MGGHRQSTNIRSSIKARGPPGPIHSIQQQPPSVPPSNVVDNGHDRMVMKITSGGGSRSGSPTPRNSPKSTHQILEEYQLQPHQVTLFCITAFYLLTRFIKIVQFGYMELLIHCVLFCSTKVMRAAGNQQFSNSGQQAAQPQAPLSSHPPSAHSTLTRHQINQVVNQLSGVHHLNPSQGAGDSTRSSMSGKRSLQNTTKYEPRIVMPVMKKSGDLGVRLVR